MLGKEQVKILSLRSTSIRAYKYFYTESETFNNISEMGRNIASDLPCHYGFGENMSYFVIQWWWHFHLPLTQIQSAFQQSHDADYAEILKYSCTRRAGIIRSSITKFRSIFHLLIRRQYYLVDHYWDKQRENICAIDYLFSLTDLFFCDFLDHKTLESHLLNLVLIWIR